MAWVNTSPLVKTYTIEEFWQLPESPDRSKVELIAGVLFMTPPQEYYHDNTVSRLADLLLAHKAAKGSGASSIFLARRSGQERTPTWSRICFMYRPN